MCNAFDGPNASFVETGDRWKLGTVYYLRPSRGASTRATAVNRPLPRPLAVGPGTTSRAILGMPEF